MSNQLYMDIMTTIKNVYFCIEKFKVDHPNMNSTFYIILLGMDRLEILFGNIHTIVGNNANADMLQLCERLGGTTEASNMLALHPEWDCSPRQLHLIPMPCETNSSATETAQSSDHLSPQHWAGDTNVSNVSLQTSWRRG
ncbi:hypothetical protein FA15DRAFT_558450, partial [Coprinopsis marcescibilis]